MVLRNGADHIDFRIGLRRGDLPYQKISDTQGFDVDGHANFALAVASLGDLDGDGVGDLAARGSRRILPEEPFQFEFGIWILFLNADGTVKNYTLVSGEEEGFDPSLGGLGYTLSALGDLNGDGITELATGDNGADDGGGRNEPDRDMRGSRPGLDHKPRGAPGAGIRTTAADPF